ncbi:MAG: hypothetical protein J6S67_01575 [Methanobrevibacter sp.]|nr:hypothetical protein [Methanobrevibacter sp.]
MSKYTTEVRYICETAAGYDESKGFNDVDQIINDSIDNIFTFDFPIFDESYRNVICSKILRHYYTREIGFETVGLWKLKLYTKLNEIMPFYNQLYNSELIKFNPLYDVDLQTTHVGGKNSETNKEESKTGFSNINNERQEAGTAEKSNNLIEGENRQGTNRADDTASVSEIEKNSRTGSTSESGEDTKNKVNANNYSENTLNYDLYSDTPQGGLTGVDNETYLTNARKITDTKSGKKDDTELEKNDYSKSGGQSESGESARTNIGSSNSSSRYDESNDKTTFGNESVKNDRSSTDKTSKNDVENINGRDKFNSTESYVLHVVGKQAGVSYSKLLKEFRETFLNIDMEVINSLSDLFLNLW